MLRPLPLLLLLLAPAAQGQGVMQPLTIHGVEQQHASAVRARGMGAVFAAMQGSAESTVLNPASLASLARPVLSASATWLRTDWAETQHWNPNRYYAGLSLFFSDPDDYRSEPLSRPDWTFDQRLFQLAAVGGALPFGVAGRKLAVGIMAHQRAHLGSFDRNDNVLEPYIGRFRPDPVERPRPGEEIEVRWSAFERERTGTMRALSVALAMEASERFHIGLRLSRTSGSSADRQTVQDVGMFFLREDAHDYSYEPTPGMTSWSGSSDFSGWNTALGLRWEHPVLSLGMMYELPHSVKQRFRRTGMVQAAASGNSGFTVVAAGDIRMPSRVTAGVLLRPSSRIALAADYFRQNYESLSVRSIGPDRAPDWGLARGVGLGAEWQLLDETWLRAGVRRDPQPFRIEGFGLVGQTATGDALSLGLGRRLGQVMLDAAYEFRRLRYEDRWESNVDYNRIRRHNFLLGASYVF